jgi:hypothetical protein
MPMTALAPSAPFSVRDLPAPGLLPSPVTIVFFSKLHVPLEIPTCREESDGIVLDFSNTSDIQSAFGLDSVAGLDEKIRRFREDDVVYACIDPYSQDVDDTIELLVSGSYRELQHDCHERSQDI